MAQTPADLEGIALALLQSAARILLLTGELGAGKTTLVKALCKGLGSDDEISSPTFSLVNEYRDASDEPIYHIDLYRLTSLDEALGMGIEEYLNSGAWCFIEWPELIIPLVTDEIAVRVNLEPQDDGSRRIVILK